MYVVLIVLSTMNKKIAYTYPFKFLNNLVRNKKKKKNWRIKVCKQEEKLDKIKNQVSIFLIYNFFFFFFFN